MEETFEVDLAGVVAVYRRRVDELTYENALLAVAVDQLQAKLSASASASDGPESAERSA